MKTRNPAESEELEARYLALLERCAARIDRVARSWTRSPPDLDELRAEIHLQLWRSLPAFEGRSREDTWLYRVALNTAMSHARTRRQRSESSLDDPAGPEPTVAASAPTEMAERSIVNRVRAALRELPDLDRAIVSLWLEELAYREIAEVTGLSESNVGVRLHRARKRLARRLGETPIGAKRDTREEGGR